MNRMRQLDGVRGIAVALVVLHHWTLRGHELGLGNVGVQLFFVLSGFLITGILLDFRRDLDTGQSTLKSVLASFWQSRAARIVPVVLLTLTAVLLAGDRFERRSDMLWHYGFASNFLFFKRGAFDSSLAHFWTLAVEQQFYLVWPALVLLVPLRRLERLILALVVLAPVSRFAFYAAGWDAFAQFNVLPFANFDSLGMGALMATWAKSPDRSAARESALATLALACAVAVMANRAFGPLPANVEQTFFAIAFSWLVAKAGTGIPGLPGRVFGSRALVGLGVISYGVYVYHVFAPRAIGAFLRTVGASPRLQEGFALFMLSALLTTGVACASWFLMERPINNARRQWQRRSQSKAPSMPPDVQPANPMRAR